MRVLFIGGTGVISSGCVQPLLDRGVELAFLNRGQSARPTPKGVQVLMGDVYQSPTVQAALHAHTFDVVVNWIAYEPSHIEADLQRFSGKVQQYIFISSASAYQKPPASLPIRESTPLHNPIWDYSQHKIACEARLMRAYRETGFPVTIVRPSHTYDRTYLPIHGGWTNLARLRVGKPIVIHGDGTSLWTMTHHRDFGRAFAGLVGNPHALGEAFHITSDESLTWNQVYAHLAGAFGVPLRAVHIASERIAAADPGWGDSLLGDKAHSVLFDNSKIKGLVPGWRAEIPFWRGAAEIAAHYTAHPELQVSDETFDRTLERLLAAESELKGELVRRR